jgi:DNA primase
MTAPSTTSDTWVEQARAVPIESEVARRGGLNLKRRGKELIGPCPRCGGDDRFAVSITKQIFNCRGCGAKGDVIDLVMHLDGADFIAAATTLAGDRPQAKPNGKGNGKHEEAVKLTEVVAGKWKYEDKAGDLLFGVKRIEYQNPDGSFVLKADGKRKKDFPQGRVDPRSGKWIWRLKIDGVPDVPVVPYGLPELIKNSSAPVFVVEGELKVHALRKWGLIATCNAGGARKWTAEHAEFLRGRDVAVIPDNDAPGREHAEMVARSLIGIAKEIHIIELPGLGPKEDIVDWIERGNILDTLRLLVEQSKHGRHIVRQKTKQSLSERTKMLKKMWQECLPAPALRRSR